MVLAAGGISCSKGDAAGGGPGGDGGRGGGPPGMPVEVAVAQAETVEDAIAATGQIEALQSIELRPEVDGRIVDILVTEGREVESGTPLFKVDDQTLRAEVDRAEAERDLATQALERTRKLMEERASSAADLERAEAQARSARAQYALLKLRLDRTVVRAPFSGVVGQRFVSLGDYVTPATRLVTLQTVAEQRATFFVAERYAERLTRGQRVAFRVSALPGREFAGRVDFIDPVVQLPARTILIKAQVSNRDRALQPGMFIEARLVTAVRAGAVMIPEDAILPIEGANFVWVAADGKATRREVTLGVRTTGFVEITKGVQAGEQVVVGGQERLAEGAPVMPTVVDRKAVTDTARR